ncbi:MAG TPA: protein translocase subunit SecDF [Bacteroidales bacterium]|nr:protein translocase subunit SecDF [Bacteroidales bacterium]HPT02851.1 protein translocase subunit SecDF [Bacteroidales bacterium]
MQNKGAIRFFAIAFALVCLFQLSFTIVARITEKKAVRFAQTEAVTAEAKQLAKGNAAREIDILDSLVQLRKKYFLDSVSNQPVYNLLIRKYTYKECLEHEINLGLDLKGGMNVTMEVSVSDVVKAMSGNSTNETFVKAMNMANEKMKNSQSDFVTLFGESFTEIDPNAKLSAIFGRMELRDKIKPNSTNEEVLKVIRQECTDAFDRTFNILRNRIDRFGVAQPNVQKLQTSDRILIELPGIKEPDRVRKLLQGTAQLEFWETYQFNVLSSYFTEANKRLASGNILDTLAAATDTIKAKKAADSTVAAKADTTKKTLAEKLKSDTTGKKKDNSFENYAKENPLFAYMRPAYYQGKNNQYYASDRATVGYAAIKDTARVNALLKKVKNIFPQNLVLAWTAKPSPQMPDVLELTALKASTREGTAALDGSVVVDARQDYDQNGRVEVSMNMNSEGAKKWKRLTADNIGKQVAIVLDGYVQSAPNVNDEIPNGRSSITGNYSIEEAQDLANVLKAGKLPAPARIVQEEIVGPSLGTESINSGFLSFIIAFVLVLLYMQLYYNRAGLVANIALLTNVFFLVGVLASIGAVLTLPGIAGIVLTMGMAVDANVIIYERIREETRAGKGLRLAINDGFKHAYSAIIDGQVTTIITGIVLYIFGSGPIQGFATTLIIGILTSLFSAIFISRLVFERLLDRNIPIPFGNKYTINAFTNVNIDFIGIRKILYCVSGGIILIGIISLATKGLNYGVDFAGGRSYIVRFDQNIKTNDVREALSKSFGEAPEVKTFGPSNQVKITTKYMVEDRTAVADSVVEHKMYDGLKGLYKAPVTFKDFSVANETIGILNSQKVDPTISDDIKKSSVWAVTFALIAIFLYIFIRFRKWQYGLGGVISLTHDTLITISMYSIFYGILPFSLEVDQSFIAAILTIIGYSINDSVIIFDRIREWTSLYPKRDLKTNMNGAMNSTLGRTFNTSGTTLVTLIAIFIFGGDVIRGFIFALIVGIAIGTYSSIFNATPVAYDFIMIQKRRAEKKALAQKK